MRTRLNEKLKNEKLKMNDNYNIGNDFCNLQQFFFQRQYKKCKLHKRHFQNSGFCCSRREKLVYQLCIAEAEMKSVDSAGFSGRGKRTANDCRWLTKFCSIFSANSMNDDCKPKKLHSSEFRYVHYPTLHNTNICSFISFAESQYFTIYEVA